MATHKQNHALVQKLALVGILTALTTVLSCIKIPVMGTVTVTLVLPVVVIGAAICGPYVGAWLTVLPAIITLGSAESANFLIWSPVGAVLTICLKGILCGFGSGWTYRLLSQKSSIKAVTCAAIAAPIINTGVFILGCYLFIWDKLVIEAQNANISMGILLLGMAIINFVIELILNIILCPSILRIIEYARKKDYTK